MQELPEFSIAFSAVTAYALVETTTNTCRYTFALVKTNMNFGTSNCLLWFLYSQLTLYAQVALGVSFTTRQSPLLEAMGSSFRW